MRATGQISCLQRGVLRRLFLKDVWENKFGGTHIPPSKYTAGSEMALPSKIPESDI
jgi:hypothetical protein